MKKIIEDMHELEKYKTSYINLSLLKKREMILDMLSLLLGQGENFDTVYFFIQQNPEEISESSYNEIFEILLWGLYSDSQEKQNIAENLLLEVKDKLLKIRLQERNESEKDDRKNPIESIFFTL